MKLLWTLHLRGGTEVSISLPAWGLNQRHDGGMSVWKILCDQKTVDSLAHMLRGTGCSVEVWTEMESSDQTKERRALVGVQKEDHVFRTEKCPGCSFYDPTTETNCGIDDWEPSLTLAIIQRHKSSAEDARQCPEGVKTVGSIAT